LKPLGLSIEARKRAKRWFWYTGRQKLLHSKPSRWHKDRQRGWNIDYFDRGPYDHRQWKDIDYGKEAPCAFKFDFGFGNWRWFNDKKPFLSGAWSWIPRLPYFYISIHWNKFNLQFGFLTYIMDKFTQGIPQQGRNDPKYRAIYPRFIRWGKAKEAGNIYLKPIWRYKNGG